MIRKMVIAFLFLMTFVPRITKAEKVWQAQNLGLNDIDMRSIAVFSGNDKFICTCSRNSVYLSQDADIFWKEIFSLKGEEGEINFVTFDSADLRILYLATDQGLFVTKSKGEDWQRLFRRVNEQTNKVNWIAIDKFDSQRIYIGTGEGLYFSSDLGQTWTKADGGLPHSSIRALTIHPTNSSVLYLANTYGLFKSIDRGHSWERIKVSTHKIVDDEDGEDDGESSQTDDSQNLINCIAIDKDNPHKVFIATGGGIFVSSDSGESWNKLPGQGLSCDNVNFIVTPSGSDREGIMYAATQEGVFEFLPGLNSWKAIYQGMTAQDVRSLALNTEGTQIFAATDRGVFRTQETANAQNQKEPQKEVQADRFDKVDSEKLLQEVSLNEPTIQQVQEAALRYGEVIHPQSIRALRRNARLKALLPDVSLDYDKTIQSGGTGGNFGAFVVGPRAWGFSLSWDVGDLIFSEQIRLIDSNTRLMIQLRDDILNEVTRLYYERRKLQTEVIVAPSKNSQENIIKRLRLEELTANIDALTGGYFSRQLK